jgi:hypothetical protein
LRAAERQGVSGAGLPGPSHASRLKPDRFSKTCQVLAVQEGGNGKSSPGLAVEGCAYPACLDRITTPSPEREKAISLHLALSIGGIC